MQLNRYSSTAQTQESLLATHKVLRNTYFLLSLTLLFSAATAGLAMVTNTGPINPLIAIVGMFGLLFLTQSLRNSAWGLVSIFAFTGFMGYILGPTLSMFMHTFSNGTQLILTSLGATGVIFLGLSAYVLTTRKDFSYLGGMLFVGMLTGILLSLGALFFHMPMLQLAISALFVLIASGLILFDTSRIINNGETNYILATIALYMDIYILFTNLLSIFGATSSRD